MSNIIERVKIEKLFGEENVDWKLRPDVNVLVGKNGLGKSTILKLIRDTLLRKSDTIENEIANHVFIQFIDDKVCEAKVGIELESLAKELRNFINTAIENNAKITFKNDNEVKEINPTEFTKEFIASFSKLIENKDSNPIKKVKKPSIQFKGNKKETALEFVSTVDMNANSATELTTVEGLEINFLDFQMTNFLMNLNMDRTVKTKVTKALNSFFQDNQKTVKFIKNGLNIILNSGDEIPFQALSSGERQLIYIFLKVANATRDNALILMDEPEISLHLAWQEKLISEIRKVNDKSQLIIVTHSPAIVMNGWMDSFIDINDIFVGE